MSGIIGTRESRGSGVVAGQVPANADIDHDALANFAAGEHYTQANITALGTVTSGTISTGAVIDDPTMTQGSDATGDVYYRAASGKLTRLATGADGTVLTSTGAGAVPAFEAAAAGGKILQVSDDTTGQTRTDINVGNDTFVDTVVTAPFTPSVSGSDVIVNAYFSVYGNNTSGDLGFVIRFKRAISGVADAFPTSLSGFGSGSAYGSGYFSYTGELHWVITPVLLDSPNTDSEITYTLQCAEYNAEGLYCGAGQGVTGRWHIWFMEVAR